MLLKNDIKFVRFFNDTKVDANVKPSEKKNSQQVLGDNRWQERLLIDVMVYSSGPLIT